MAKIKLGDILEIVTPAGKAYLHYIYKDESIGDLIRVLPGVFSERPNNFEQLAGSRESYMVFFPVSLAKRRKMVAHVSYYPTTGFTKPEYMRDSHTIRGEFLGWHIINTENWKRQLVKKLSREQIEFSPWGVWNFAYLVERISENWPLQNWQ